MNFRPPQLLMGMALLSAYSIHSGHCYPQTVQQAHAQQRAETEQGASSAQKLFNETIPLIGKRNRAHRSRHKGVLSGKAERVGHSLLLGAT